METLYIVMPAYNEEGIIRDVVEQWYSVLEDKSEKSRLIVADSGSTDNTHKILLDLQKTHPQLEILSTTNKYHGPKVIALYDYALNNNADYIFQTDSDGQTAPEDFSSFWNDRDKYDGIFGNRTVRGDGKDRAFVEKVVCIMLKIFFSVKIPDANAPFRLMRAEALKRHLYRLPTDYNIPNILITTYFVYFKERFAFKEITFSPRTTGKNSVNFIKIFKIGLKSLKDFHTLRIGMKSNER